MNRFNIFLIPIAAPRAVCPEERMLSTAELWSSPPGPGY